MKELPLAKGEIALVDDEDFYELIKTRWHREAGGYITGNVLQPDGSRKQTKLHRYLLKPPHRHISVDHINGNVLDNTRANLRMCTHSENLCNRGKSKNNSSGYKGVFPYKDYTCAKKWGASISKNGKRIHLGTFITAEEAHEAYKKAAIELHGEFAKW